MDMTIIQNIIARASGNEEVAVGDKVWCAIDLAAMRDFGGPNVVLDYREMFGDRPVKDPNKVAITFDLHLPARDAQVANNQKLLRDFARQTGVHLFDVETGVGQHTLLENGMVRPYDVIVGTDSHMNLLGAVGAFATGVGTTDLVAAMATGKLWFKVPETHRFVVEGAFKDRVGAKDLILHVLKDVGTDGLLYKAVEFEGPAIDSMDVAARITTMSMVTEMSGKIGLIESNDQTMELLGGVTGQILEEWHADPGAPYVEERRYDVTDLPPLVAAPHSPDNVMPAADLKGTHVDQVFVGSCTNGRVEDLRAAAEVLKGEQVARGMRLIITPATQNVAKDAVREGLYNTFIEAGAIVTNPSCALCTIGHPGVLAEGDVTMSTSNRNFPGKIGKGGEIYLCSPATAAASALYGEITDPRGV
ncbi:MAG: 3-isopropylmalate dehydratase large subunit [Thermoplasmata archaeon]|nr:3-isopropylmalate dehydratase large subunit [Thermoplasmata archaeon]